METRSLAEVAGKRSDCQSEQDGAEEVNKDLVGMKCDTEHGAQEISEVSSNNKDYCEKQKNDGKGESEVRRNKIPQDTALAQRHSIDCHAILEKPETSVYSGKRRRKQSCSSILVEPDELGEMFSPVQRRKIQKTCDVASEDNPCKQSSNQQIENQILSIEDEEMECGDTKFINECEDTGSIDEDTGSIDEDTGSIDEDTEPKDESEDTEPKDESEDTDPKDESEDTDPKDESEDTDPKDESEDTDPKAESEDTDPKDESEDTDPKDESIDTDRKDEYDDTDPNDEYGDTDPNDESEDSDFIVKLSKGQKQPKYWTDIRDSKLEALNKLLDEYDSNKEELNEEILPLRDILDDNLFKVTYCDFEERFHFLIEIARNALKNIINEYLRIQPELVVENLRPKVFYHNLKLKILEITFRQLHWECVRVLRMYEITNDNIPLPVFMLECMYSFINTARDIIQAFSYDVKDILDDLS